MGARYEIPPGYVPGIFGTGFLLALLGLFSLGVFYHYDRILEIPSAPKIVVLKAAFVHKDISRISKTTSNLYLCVGTGDEIHDYVIEASTEDVRNLNIIKSRKLWVAIEQERSERFVWAVYDHNFELLISRQKILEWARYKNIVNYFIVVAWGVLSLFLLFILCKYGVWNRVLARRKASSSLGLKCGN